MFGCLDAGAVRSLMRPLLLGLLASVSAACSVDACKKGTVFLTYNLQGGAAAADTIDITLTEGKSAPKIVSVPRKSHSSSGSIEVDFGSYPASQSLSFTLTARAGNNVLASATQSKIASPNCTALSFTLNGNAHDASAIDLAGTDASQLDGGAGVGPDLLTPVDCTNVDLNCPAHSTCGNVGGSAGCVCIAGYQMSNGNCVWGTVPQDPGFANSPMAWNLVQGATIAPTAGGAIDPGWVVFDRPSICGVHVPAATQTITIPPYALAQPLKFKVSQYADCTGTGGGGSQCYGTPQSGGLNIMMGGAANFFPYVGTASTTTQSLCLGERAYGGTMSMLVLPWDRAFCGSAATYTQYVDHIDIEPDSSCPLPGTIPNANFDGTGNWVPSTAGSSLGSPPVAEIKAGVGTGGSNAAHLATSSWCGWQAMIDGTISVPLTSVPNLALQMTVTGTNPDTLQVIVGGGGIGWTSQFPPPLYADGAGWVAGTGSKQTARFCLLETHKGQALPIRFFLTMAMDPGGSCQPPRTADFVFDDLAFVSDPTCAATSLVPDGSFERLDPGLGYLAVGNDTGTAAVVQSAANAHSGTHAFQGTIPPSSTSPPKMELLVPISVPSANNGAGPAVSFWYKLPTATNFFCAAVGNLCSGSNLAVAATYTQHKICVDPMLIGHSTFLTVQGFSNNGATTETIWVDDVTVGTDPTCPAN